MKKLAMLFLVFVASGVNAQVVFESYEGYYRETFKSIFSSERSLDLRSAFDGTNGDIELNGNTFVNGERVAISIANGVIRINGNRFKLSRANYFNNEHVSFDDFGRITKFYFSPEAACLESAPNSASGSAVRHKAVYLIAPIKISSTGIFIKLPSLFASCLAISKDKAGNFIFPAASYRYASNELEAEGIDFQMFVYKSRMFIATPEKKSIRFVEKENLYRFIESTPSRSTFAPEIGSPTKALSAKGI